MEYYEDPCCSPMPASPSDIAPPAYEPAPAAPAPAPVAPEPAPVLTFEPPAPAAVAPVPAPVAYDPPAPVSVPVTAPVDAGSLLGPSTVGGSADPGYTLVDPAGNTVNPGSLLGPATIGGTPQLTFGSPDLGGSQVGGSANLGVTWTDGAGNPVAEVPVTPGPFSGAAAMMHATANANLAAGMLRDGTDAYPAPWTPGYDSDRDRIPNEADNNPTNRWAR